MKQKWIKREENPACILFFNGWGMDENVLNGFDHGNFDVCHWNDFNQTELLAADEFPYREIIVVAWSLGVCAANEILSKSGLNVSKSLAINGTPWAWNDQLAIPHATFKQTLDGWNERNRFKFNLRMFGGKTKLEEAAEQLSQRSIDNQQRELQFFYDLGQSTPYENRKWDAALVGMNDQIVPAANQLSYWPGKTAVIQTEWVHFPFAAVKSWHELLKMTEQC